MSTTIARPKIQTDQEVKLLTKVYEEKCTILHCTYHNTEDITSVRIWPSTFLIQDNGKRIKLIKAFNISMAPHWTHHFASKAHFTLLFEGLSKDCVSFHLLEDIPEEGNFFSDPVKRNKTDVYNCEVQCAF